MLLYHGTSEAAALVALKHGLKPRGKKKGNWKHTILSRPDAVYLTQAYAPYYAMCVSKDKQRWAVLEVDTEKLDCFKLVPDEDALEQVTRGKDDVPGDMTQRTRWYRQRLHEYNHLVELSLQALGNCCYLGDIPAQAITRVAFIGEECPTFRLQAFDPTITILNYAICGAKYRGLTKWLFDIDLGDDTPTFRGKIEEHEYWDWNIPPVSERSAIQIIGKD
jgi:hypothetical protein